MDTQKGWFLETKFTIRFRVSLRTTWFRPNLLVSWCYILCIYIYIYIIHVYVALVFNIIHWNYHLGRSIILSHILNYLWSFWLSETTHATRRIIWLLSTGWKACKNLIAGLAWRSWSHPTALCLKPHLWNVESHWNNQLFHDLYLINERFCGSRLLQKVGLGLWWIGSMILTKNPAQNEMVSVTPLPKGWTPETRKCRKPETVLTLNPAWLENPAVYLSTI